MISIALATYNGEKYLRDQLDSILAQTVTDWELVICDDCSHDNTVQVLQEYKARDSRIQIFKNEVNLGFKKNFEKAISLCKGEYIALSDQDDIWCIDHLEKLLNNLGDSNIICGSVALVNSDGKTIAKKLGKGKRYIAKDGNLQFFQLLHINFIQGCTCLFRRELVSKIIPIPENQKYHDNWIGLVGGLDKKPIVFIDDVILQYRRHDDNVTAKKKISAIEATREKMKWNEDAEKYLTDEAKIKIYNSVHDYSLRFIQKKVSLKDIAYFFRNYKLIYQTKNIGLFIPRFLKRFVFFS